MKLSNKTLLCSCLGVTAAAFLFASAVAQSTGSKTPTPTPAPTKAATPAKPANAAAAPKSHETVEYKDPEDMTTRYRPGNNKTTSVPASSASTLPASPTTGQAATDATAKKHLAGVKYQNREAGLPACDGASKDPAKCVAAPPAAASSGTASTPAAQDSKGTNKVDSFTVKQ
jgi:hypothetical protein